MNSRSNSIRDKAPGKLFVPSLALTMYADANLNMFLSLFLIDIALTFGVSVGVASQIGMISAIATIVAGILMGALSVKYSYKCLLLIGAAIITVGVFGCYLAPSFAFVQFFYPFDGIGSVMASAMSFALIGSLLPLEKRSRAVGWAMAAGSLTFVIGAPLSVFIAAIAGWRSVLLWLFLPISFVGIVLAYFGIPSVSNEQKSTSNIETYISSFKRVLLNKSAVACLLGYSFFNASQVWGLFAVTFYRTRFSVPIEYASIILVMMTLTVALGSVAGGRLVIRFGRKRLAVFSLGLSSALIVLFVSIPCLWIVIVLDLTSVLFRGVGFVATTNLTLEQIEQSRGTIMSLSGVFCALGGAIGVAVGGSVLDNFGFLLLAVVFGTIALMAVLIIYFFVKDPYKT